MKNDIADFGLRIADFLRAGRKVNSRHVGIPAYNSGQNVTGCQQPLHSTNHWAIPQEIRNSKFAIRNFLRYRPASYCLAMILALLLLSPSLLAGQAGWDTVKFDLTKNDAAAYAANIPDDAFTAGGLKLPAKDGAGYSLTSKQSYGGEFDLDAQIEIVDRNDAGTITIDLVLTNDQKQRKVVASMLNYPKPAGEAPAARPGRAAVAEGANIEHLECRYFKDGKAMKIGRAHV